MQSSKLRALTPRLLALGLLSTGLSACVTPIVVSQTALPCREIVKASGLLDPTPGAARPQDHSVGEIAAFGDRQTGQLDKSNADKRGARAILDVCADAEAKAREAAQKKSRRKILGVF